MANSPFLKAARERSVSKEMPSPVRFDDHGLALLRHEADPGRTGLARWGVEELLGLEAF